MSATRCSGIWNAGPRTSTLITCLFEASLLADPLPPATAHLLRHTAATEMLRNGVPLDQAGLVLRHRSIDMTAYYAKADVALLKQIAQPWPEVNG